MKHFLKFASKNPQKYTRNFPKLCNGLFEFKFKSFQFRSPQLLCSPSVFLFRAFCSFHHFIMANHPSTTVEFFLHGNARQFEYVLNLYPQVLKLKAEEKKKPEELIKLDEW